MSKQLWTPEEVTSRIRILHENGYNLSSGNVAKISPKLVAAAQRHFGSWRQAVRALGIDYSSIVQSARQEAYEKRAKWSKELIVERIRELAARKESLQGAVVSLKYVELYRAACSPRYFGGWLKAVEAADVPIQRCARGERTQLQTTLSRWKTELLLERIGQIAGSDSGTDERVIKTLAPSLHEATIRRFGSWAKAVRAVQDAGEASNVSE